MKHPCLVPNKLGSCAQGEWYFDSKTQLCKKIDGVCPAYRNRFEDKEHCMEECGECSCSVIFSVTVMLSAFLRQHIYTNRYKQYIVGKPEAVVCCYTKCKYHVYIKISLV